MGIIVMKSVFVLGFKDEEAAEKFCAALETDSKDGMFVYQGQEFQLPPIPPGQKLMAEYGPNDHPINKKQFPVKVEFLLVPANAEV